MSGPAMLLLSVFVVFLGCTAAGPTNNRKPTHNTYMVTAMKHVTIGQPFDVHVHVLNATSSVRFIVQVVKQWANNSKTFKSNVMTRRVDAVTGEHKTVTLKIPRGDVQIGSYILKVRARKGLVFERESHLIINNKIVSIFIQTDKAIYKPGHVVHMRAFAVYPNLKQYYGPMEIVVTDPNHNTIKHWKVESVAHGVVSQQMMLSSQPLNGDWKITVTLPEFENTRQSKSFTVRQYELPKFEVTIDVPPFMLLSDSDLTGTIKTKYTFGKPVKGMAELKVFIGQIRDSCGNYRRSVNKAFPIDGEQEFRIGMPEIRKLSYISGTTKLTLVAYVTEDLTGKTLNGTGSLKIHEHPEKIEFLDSTPSSFKPGLPFRAYVKVARQDDTPVEDDTFGIEVFTCVDYERTEAHQSKYECSTFTGSYSLPAKKLSIPANGIIPIDMDIPVNTTNIKMRAYYKDIFCYRHTPQAKSPSKTFVQVKLMTDTQSIKAGTTAKFSVLATQVPKRVFYQIMSRGRTVISGSVAGTETKHLTFDVNITATMSPTASVLVHFVRNDGEIVADSISFNVDDIFENKVSIKFSQDEAEPHTRMDVMVTADSMSQVNLLAVDQSVLLLKSGNDITVDQVTDELKTYDRSAPPDISPYYSVSSAATTAYDIFKNAGVLVMTDAKLHQSRRNVYRGYSPPGPYLRTGVQIPGPAQYSETAEHATIASDSAPVLKEVDRIREIFPETWLWTNTTTGADGMAVINTEVPDTITSWIASAFALNAKSGLGVSPTTAKLRVFRSFFVRLTLPTSIVRGEQVVIQASVFNYLGSDVSATVQLAGSGDFQSIMYDDNGEEVLTSGDQKKTVMVTDGEAASVYFPIVPNKLGKIDIQVSARSPAAADAVKQQLLVEPEGVKREVNIPILVDHTDSSETFSKVLELETPSSLVPGSQRLRITATGDLLGHSIDGLDSLLSIPVGCGEQNMLKFAPDVFIADYLTTTKQMTPELSNRITTYLELGYQRQLFYQRSDGSFSAFGNRDESGSTWLTAFVLKGFQQAKRYTLIGNATIDRALHWLIGTQNTDGFFNEQGTILDVNIMDDQGSYIGLTAYVLTALIENKDHDGFFVKKEEIRNVTTKALQYLEMHTQNIESNYTLALLAYTLSLAESSHAGNVFGEVLTRAVRTDGGKRHWIHIDKSDKVPIYLRENTTPTRAKSIDILITSYVLLTYVQRGEISRGTDVMQWITSQRNPHGGFASSQDTVVALEALTKFAAVARPTNFQINVAITVGQQTIEINIDDSNALVINSYEYEDIPRIIDIVSTGRGMAVIEIGLFYNIEKEDWGESSFEVNTVLIDDYIDGFTLMTCSKYLGEGQTGMCIQEIQIPSGFVADLTSPGNIAGLKRLEQRGSDVVAYFDQIGKTSTCMKLACSRTSMVAKAQRYHVTVQAYYDPNKIQTVSYQPRKLRDSTVCDLCENCPECAMVK
ncbi:CD109 antigen-like isoform X2 [Gigantopelta aegis]|uniref:CD109 antigen-like isoform X2 n=1 Tax=Gigantopelta aegis TaxID=1735272 RepID=UPI001B888749|nr:CD109 antigen-like isoform X2 [Gigantopelta aegis]